MLVANSSTLFQKYSSINNITNQLTIKNHFALLKSPSLSLNKTKSEIYSLAGNRTRGLPGLSLGEEMKAADVNPYTTREKLYVFQKLC